LHNNTPNESSCYSVTFSAAILTESTATVLAYGKSGQKFVWSRISLKGCILDLPEMGLKSGTSLIIIFSCPENG